MASPSATSPVRTREGLFGIATENPTSSLHLKRRLSGILIVPEEHELLCGDVVVLDPATSQYFDAMLEQFPKPPRTLPTTIVPSRGRSATTDKEPAGGKSNWTQGLKGFAERWTMGFSK